jgi:type III secretory pathway component EscS
MRRPFTSISNFVSWDVLKLSRSSLLERYTNISIVFLVSAVFHVIVDMLQSIPTEKSGSIPFYLAFVIGIMLEDGVQELWKNLQPRNEPEMEAKRSTKDVVPLWKWSIGLVWVMLWLGVTSTWYFTPMIQATTEDMRMVPVSAARYIGLGPLTGIVAISGAIIAFTFEIEI